MLNVSAGTKSRSDRRESAVAPFLADVTTFHLVGVAWPNLIYPRLIALGERTLAYALANLPIRL
jgi:hypothetical protein